MKRYNNNIYIALLLTLVAGACKVSKDIPKPTNAAPEQFRNSTATDSLSIASLPYKEFFKEKAIRDLIDTAVINNYDIQIAVKNIESASLVFKQAKLGNVPSVNLQVNANTNRFSDNSLNGLSLAQYSTAKHIEDYNATVGLSWEADIWNKIGNQRREAGAAFLQSAEAKKAVQTRLVANVAEGFYNLIMLDTQLDIAKRNLSLNDSTLTIIKLQFDAGQVTSLAIQQAEAQELVAAGLVPQLEQMIGLQEDALSILTGAFPKTIARAGLLGAMQDQNNLSTGFPAAMVSLRPDVKSAELELVKANAKVGIAKAGLYPSFVISATGGVDSYMFKNWFNIPGSLFGMVAGGLTQPIFQHKEMRTQYELALVDRDKAVIQFKQSVLKAVGDVSDQLVKIEKLKQQYTIADTRVGVVKLGLSNANLLFKSGMANYLEVITAQSNALQSELDLATIKTDQLNAEVELYRALGGGWK